MHRPKKNLFQAVNDRLGPHLSVLEIQAISELESLLFDESRRLRVVEAQELARFPQAQLSQFCVQHGYYQLVTTELVDFVQEQIAGRQAIELCAGGGTLGRALGIPLTDSRLQERPEVAALYFAMGQATITYPADVERRTAAQAVSHYAPEVVVGAYVTPQGSGNESYGSHENGPDEVAMLTRGFGSQRPDLYVHVGNRTTHGDKPLFKHREVKAQVISNPGWLYGRAKRKELNEIYLFTRRPA